MPWRGQIPNLNYYAPEVYAEELQLFKKGWQFFATIYDFHPTQPNEDGSTIYSIERIVSDRTVILERDESTSRSYYLSQNDSQLLAHKVPCLHQILGSLIFVSLLSCEKTLFKFTESKLSIPTHLLKDVTGKFASLTFKLDANWKIALQNALEDYHIATIHPS